MLLILLLIVMLLLILPLYIGVFVVFSRFRSVIKVMTDINEVFAEIDKLEKVQETSDNQNPPAY